MPELIGRNIGDAANTIDEAQLTTQIITRKDPEQAGLVINSDPKKGTSLKANSKVKITVATGQKDKDFDTALTLISRHPNLIKANISADEIRTRFRLNKVTDLPSLISFSKMTGAKMVSALKLDQTEIFKTAPAVRKFKRVVTTTVKIVAGTPKK